MRKRHAHRVTRRTFVSDSAKLALGAMVVPRHVLGGSGFRAPSDTLNVACVGVGGMGMNNASSLVNAGENLVAVCDVDYAYVERQLAGRLRPNREGRVSPETVRFKEAYEKATKYTDFREMLERQRDIDAVIIATPDHLHAVIANAAMKAGKHVYVQKPLTYSVHEARVLARTAAETKVATQMGNQGHSFEGTRRINEIVASGILGPIREVYVWTDRPQRYWAQGIPGPEQVPSLQPPANRPAAGPAPATQPQLPPAPPSWNIRTVERAILKEMASNPTAPPEGLRWDLFLGPAAEVGYHPAYHPFSWRGWVPFGVSAIGDMGAHLLDQPYWALGLDYPTSVVATSTPWGGPASNPASYPLAMMAEYEFAARGNQPAVTLRWYDGGLTPILPDVVLPRGDGGGGVLVGERGYLTYETYGNDPKVYPESLAAEAEGIAKTFPRVETSHEVNWAQACKGEAKASCPFEYAAPLTELMLLGIVALRTGQGRKILYDGAAMSVTNVPEANAWLTREYRAGWAL
ncbi:MAG TPA: Gfo/Idh/MocA family oxidoreductase [Gemmatimonadaceae bacterium]|nr:Gfo/Idh/MocA family oxidoreductase [Gemmatimonadaceae bacterium]